MKFSKKKKKSGGQYSEGSPAISLHIRCSFHVWKQNLLFHKSSLDAPHPPGGEGSLKTLGGGKGGGINKEEGLLEKGAYFKPN